MKTLAPYKTIQLQADLIIEMTLPSTQDPNQKCFLLISVWRSKEIK
jgi:hypothetical protein